jgi:dihydrofolate synthase/folylpolyglutamate synthase
MFNDINQGIQWIESQIRFRPKTSLNPMLQAYSLLDINLDSIKKIHVTGTNGKGSVCMYLTSILKEQGLKVGTFTSPYLVVFNERIMLNGIPIKDDDLLNMMNDIYEVSEKYKSIYHESLSFFELMTLMALKYFYMNKVDVIIMEVGIGGLLDSTNILNYDVSLITNVGMDHMKQLGYTQEEIARNKLGIVKFNHHLITTIQPNLYDQVITHCKDVHATYVLIDTNEVETISEVPHVISYHGHTFELSLIGHYQKDNAILAYEAISYLYPNINIKTIKQGLKKTIHFGRLEMVKPQVYIDGAHNVHAMDALIESLNTTFKDKHCHILFSALADKEPAKMIENLLPHVKSLTTTSFDDPRYVDLTTLGYPHIHDPKAALEYLMGQMGYDDIILITGSLHFVGFMKKEVIKNL